MEDLRRIEFIIKDLGNGKVDVEVVGGFIEDPETEAEKVASAIISLIKVLSNYVDKTKEVKND